MKLDMQTLLLMGLIAFVVMREQKPKPLISDDMAKTVAALVKALATMKGGIVELQKRIDDLHSVSTSGY